MNDKTQPPSSAPDPATEWAGLWQAMTETSSRVIEQWSGSMAPFMLGRMLEKPAGLGDGNELSAAIEKIAQGPRLADVWDIDRKIALVFSAWIEMRARFNAYSAVGSAPWQEASKRFLESLSVESRGETASAGWRELFAKWSEISNEELIRNQRSEGFLQSQKELLQAGLELRRRQDDLAEAISVMFGQPTRREFDEVTRQLTELRREVRAMGRELRAPRSLSSEHSLKLPADQPITNGGEHPQ